MDHWITTHNPHPDPDKIEWNVYAKTHPTTYPVHGDEVLFYETETTIAGRDRPGAKALVRAARVCGDIEKRAVPIDGFDHQIPCDCHRLAKRNVPYAEVFELIPRFIQPKGWLWISRQEYFTLLGAMKLEEVRHIEVDREYRQWLDDHPNGFVINVGSDKSLEKLHRASCNYINNDQARKLAEGSNSKLCGPTIASLEADWTHRRKTPPFPRECTRCDPRG